MVLWGWTVLAAAMACSGPGAEATIERNEALGWALFALTTVIVVAATVRGVRVGLGGRSMAAGWILVLAHPGIWMSARVGDCGIVLLESGLVFSGLAAGLGLWGMIRKPEDQESSGNRSPRP